MQSRLAPSISPLRGRPGASTKQTLELDGHRPRLWSVKDMAILHTVPLPRISLRFVKNDAEVVPCHSRVDLPFRKVH